MIRWIFTSFIFLGEIPDNEVACKHISGIHKPSHLEWCEGIHHPKKVVDVDWHSFAFCLAFSGLLKYDSIYQDR